MKNPQESGIPTPTDHDIDSIIEHAAAGDDYPLKIRHLDEEIIINLYKNSGDRMNLPKEMMARIGELAEKSFSDAHDWTELYAMVASKGDLVMAGVRHKAGEVTRMIDQIRKGKAAIETITRTDGLRQKVMDLMGI